MLLNIIFTSYIENGDTYSIIIKIIKSLMSSLVKKKKKKKKKIALKVNIYLQNMSLNVYFSLGFFCVCSLSASIIKYACLNFRTSCAMAPMLTFQHEFEFPTLPSIPSNCHVGSVC